MLIKKIILPILFIFLSCDNPLDNSTSNEETNDITDTCLLYTLEDNCLAVPDYNCQWISSECVEINNASCTLNYGGFIDDCGFCSSGSTNIIPNKDKNICGYCPSDSNYIEVPPDSSLIFYDHDNDENTQELFCGCNDTEYSVINTAGCCGIIGGVSHFENFNGEQCNPDESSNCFNVATRDDCNICEGENLPNTGTCDCEGTPNGNANFDECGICDSDFTNDCVEDCLGIWGGNKLFDDCGVCDGVNFFDADNLLPNGACNCEGEFNDCNGVCAGDTIIDQCGVCDGNGVDADNDDICDDVDECIDADEDGYCEGIDAEDICYGNDVADTDSDGVCDNLDSCPLDLADDSDGDGSCDSDDVCPGFDDNIDTDVDGVADGCDPCPNDIVDDSDGDSVCESDDVCTGDDATGDTDGDGVCDDIDLCPLDINGDSDGDGSCDSDDLCEGDDTAGDTDNDGICEDIDDCEGEYDVCDACDGPGAIYVCGCSDLEEGACDCDGNIIDECGECGGDGIAAGACDCDGNVLDCEGNCGGAIGYDLNQDGICDNACFDEDSDGLCDGIDNNYTQGDINLTEDECNDIAESVWYVYPNGSTDCGDGLCDQNCEDDCIGNNYDVCGVCNGQGEIYNCGCHDIGEDECDCDGNIEDCAGVCGGDAIIDCAGICDGDEELDQCGVCNGDDSSCADCAGVPNGNSLEDECGTCDTISSNDCVQDCLLVWGGDASLDDCGVCNGNNVHKDLCGICYGDNTGCTQGIMTQIDWEFDYMGIWDNSECDGVLNYDYYNYICVAETSTCYDYQLKFYDDFTFEFKTQSWALNTQYQPCAEYNIQDQCTLANDCYWSGGQCNESPQTTVSGDWGVSVVSSYPMVLNGNELCFDYTNEDLEDFCYTSLELLNDYQDCQYDPDSCLNNVMYLKITSDDQCYLEQYSTASSNQSSASVHYNNINELPVILQNIIKNQNPSNY